MTSSTVRVCRVRVVTNRDVGMCGIHAMCNAGMGQVHIRTPMAPSTSENTRTATSTVRVCRVRVVLMCNELFRMSALLMPVFIVCAFFCVYYFISLLFFSPCLDVGDGAGTYTWPDGDKYVGEFKDGAMHGQGMAV